MMTSGSQAMDQAECVGGISEAKPLGVRTKHLP
jgi:hypothetical protein